MSVGTIKSIRFHHQGFRPWFKVTKGTSINISKKIDLVKLKIV